ncbi:extracellular solute-binding protein [Streptomyces sp. NPDC058297]|uniref:extracellular solute-binding protein n=1 Tax=Streptomyces sp. NPDC058297 TaxID=3346433 RepID=UPI0036EFF6E2
MALSRRNLLRGGLYGASAAALAPALSACGSISEAASSTGGIQYWNPFTGGDGGLMKTMVAQVERRVPGLDAESIVLEGGSSYYTKLAMSSAGGRAPDLAVMHMSRLAGYAPGGLLDAWDMDTLAEFGVTAAQLNADVFRRGHHDGVPYAIPLDTHPFVVFFDREVMAKADLVDSEGHLVPLKSPAGYLDAAERLRDVTKGGMGPVFGHVGDMAQSWRMFWSLYRQTGAEFDLTGRRIGIDRDTAVEIVGFMQKLTAPDCKHMDVGIAVGSFSSRSAPMIFSGEWDVLSFSQVKGIDLGAAPFPQLYDRPASWADSHAFVLPHQNDPDPQRRRTTHRLVAELLKASLTWAGAGHIPAYLPVVESRKYRSLEPQADYAAAAEATALEPSAWFMGAGSDAQGQMCQAMQPALIGTGTAAQAVDDMVSAINFFLGKPNPA